MTTVSCCYCAETQKVADPPVLIECVRCGRPFRVYWNYSGASIELGQDAKKFFELKKDVS